MDYKGTSNTLIYSIKGLGIFFRELIRNPAHIGAAVPSSKSLANKMVSLIPPHEDALIIELGAGTGVITQALFNSQIPHKNILVIERSKNLCKFLRARFPSLTIIEADAQDLESIVKDYNLPACGIISSLPLRSLPKAVVQNIETAVGHILTDKGFFMQYTYDLRKKSFPVFSRLKKIHNEYVWRNIPPAKIELYKI